MSVCDNGWNMDPPFHSGFELAISWVVCSQWKLSETSKNATVSRQSHGVSFLGRVGYNLHRLSRKGKIHQQRLLHSGYWCVWRPKSQKKKTPHCQPMSCLCMSAIIYQMVMEQSFFTIAATVFTLIKEETAAGHLFCCTTSDDLWP